MHNSRIGAIPDLNPTYAGCDSLRLDARDTDFPGLQAAEALPRPRMAAVLDLDATAPGCGSLRLDARDTDIPGLQAAEAFPQRGVVAVLDCRKRASDIIRL